VTIPHRPNLLLISSDQHHWQGLGTHTPLLQTPHLDKLATQGTRFERAYCPNPTCTPTRASLITGLYPSQHGAYTLGSKLPENVPVLGQYLQAAGYDSTLIGKAHFQPLRGTQAFPSLEAYPLLQDLDFWRGFHGPFYGFNHIELARNHADEAHVGQHYAIWMEENGAKNWRDWFRSPTGNASPQHRKWNIPERFHYNAWITERSCARMKAMRDHETPFLLWASFFDPHPPYLVPEPWASMYDPSQVELPPQGLDDVQNWPELMRRTQVQGASFDEWEEPAGSDIHGLGHHIIDAGALRADIAVYYGMISLLDHYIGKLLAGLEEQGLAESTLVLFTSDHGHYFGQHGLTAKGPFHFEDGLRVPMIVRWPGQVPAGRVSRAMQSLVDYAPSLLEAAGLPVPGSMAGKSQLKVWQGDDSAARTYAAVEFRHQPTKMNLRTYIDARYKLTIWNNPVAGEIYDLEADPGEHHNLWSDPMKGDLKTHLLQQALLMEMDKEPYRMPRIHPA
jgi:arylsulfatase A-like enzyme